MMPTKQSLTVFLLSEDGGKELVKVSDKYNGEILYVFFFELIVPVKK